jgi:hypothetical protein
MKRIFRYLVGRNKTRSISSWDILSGWMLVAMLSCAISLGGEQGPGEEAASGKKGAPEGRKIFSTAIENLRKLEGFHWRVHAEIKSADEEKPTVTDGNGIWFNPQQGYTNIQDVGGMEVELFIKADKALQRNVMTDEWEDPEDLGTPRYILELSDIAGLLAWAEKHAASINLSGEDKVGEHACHKVTISPSREGLTKLMHKLDLGLKIDYEHSKINCVALVDRKLLLPRKVVIDGSCRLAEEEGSPSATGVGEKTGASAEKKSPAHETPEVVVTIHMVFDIFSYDTNLKVDVPEEVQKTLGWKLPQGKGR